MGSCNSNEEIMRRLRFDREKSYSSGTSSPNLVVKCEHDVPSPVKTVKEGPNKGKKFYGCPLWKTDNCNFFEWEHDAEKKVVVHANEGRLTLLKEKEELEAKANHLEAVNEQLMKKLAEADCKIGKLRIKKNKYEAEVVRASKAEHCALTALFFSWCCFVVVVAVLVGRL